MKKKPTALLTGATGFIGSHLARVLVNEGWKIHCLIWEKQPQIDALKDIQERIKFHYYNGTTESMTDLMKKVKPDIVMHLASLFLSNHKPEDVTPLIYSNVLLGTQLVEAMVLNDVSALINTGTSWQHLHNEEYNPVCLYAATKQAFECLLKYYTEVSPLKAITLKLFDTYGPDDTRKKLFKVLRNAEEGKPFKMSPGKQLIDLVFIDDIVKAYLIAADRLLHNKAGKMETYAVSSGRLLTLKEIVKIYKKISGRRLTVQWGGIPYRKREVMVPWTKGKTIPGWKAGVSLEDGIALMENRGPLHYIGSSNSRQ